MIMYMFPNWQNWSNPLKHKIHLIITQKNLFILHRKHTSTLSYKISWLKRFWDALPLPVKIMRNTKNKFFDVLLTAHLSIFISVINQLDAQNFCFTISLFHASTSIEHTCSSSEGQNCITQPLVSSFLFCSKFISCLYMFLAHVLIIRRSKLYYTASSIIVFVFQ